VDSGLMPIFLEVFTLNILELLLLYFIIFEVGLNSVSSKKVNISGNDVFDSLIYLAYDGLSLPGLMFRLTGLLLILDVPVSLPLLMFGDALLTDAPQPISKQIYYYVHL
jgi:hypothetical protein